MDVGIRGFEPLTSGLFFESSTTEPCHSCDKICSNKYLYYIAIQSIYIHAYTILPRLSLLSITTPDTRPAFASLADKSRPPRRKLTSALSLLCLSLLSSSSLTLFSLLLNHSLVLLLLHHSSSSFFFFSSIFCHFSVTPFFPLSSYTWLRLAPSLSFRILMIHRAPLGQVPLLLLILVFLH